MPAAGVIIYDTDLDSLWVGDGVTLGGVEVGGAAGGAAYDWVEHATGVGMADQLGGAMDHAAWTDMSTWSATALDSAPALDLGGYAVVAGADYSSPVTYHGFGMTVAAGAWVYGARLGYMHSGGSIPNIFSSRYANMHFAFFDAGGGASDVTADRWAGGGWLFAPDTWGNHDVGGAYGTNITNVTNCGAKGRWTEIDVFLEHDGVSKVHVWVCEARGTPLYYYTVTSMGLGDGVIGVRMSTFSSDTTITAVLKAFAKLAAVPGKP